MNIKDRLTKPLYKHSFDGDSLHTYILFGNIDTILEEQTKIVKEYVVEVLKLAAEKAEVKTVTIPSGLNIKTCVVDKDSILNLIKEL